MNLPRPVLLGCLCLVLACASGCGKKIDAVCEEKCGDAANRCLQANGMAEALAERTARKGSVLERDVGHTRPGGM